ncbi:hypothetical protein SDC9_136359 [bioreactor metagenome]|uniref:Uncharacterized protein n=1 Tax=bioreactor metagenome TaxID=1076179 RepID=A0A645DJ25_9ZZZZ
MGRVNRNAVALERDRAGGLRKQHFFGGSRLVCSGDAIRRRGIEVGFRPALRGGTAPRAGGQAKEAEE